MKVIKLEVADSTNSWVAQHENEILPAPVMVYCHTQCAGRGQRGNSWESEPGKNITASLLFYPHEFPASTQFTISECIALAICEFLAEAGVDAKVKWPNDIYVGDQKICGILVEHVVTGKFITRTIAGFGININQTEFRSSAPNPVSLSMLTGKHYDIGECLEKLAAILEKYLEKLSSPEYLHQNFLSTLWRNDNRYYKFFDPKRGMEFEGKIHGVNIGGILTLRTHEGELREFAFKEVEHII